MAVVKVWLLGKLHVQIGDGPLLAIHAQRAQQLLCYLVLYRKRVFGRETLAETLWGNEDSAGNVSKILRQAIWHLQSELAEVENHLDIPLVTVDANWIQLNPAIDVWSDTGTLLETFDLCKGSAGSELSASIVARMRVAVDLYRGHLLDGCYENWCLLERERLQYFYLAMLDKLMDYYESRQDYDTSLTYGVNILKHDRARECTHYRLMRLFFYSGDRTSALRQYQRCADVLQDELGVDPAEPTRALYNEILSGAFPEPRLSHTNGSTPSPSSMHEVIQRLEHYQVILGYIQSRVDQELNVARQALQH